MDIFPIHFPYISHTFPHGNHCHSHGHQVSPPIPVGRLAGRFKLQLWRASSDFQLKLPLASQRGPSPGNGERRGENDEKRRLARKRRYDEETGTGHRNINRQDIRKNWRTTGERYRWIDGDRFFTGQLRGEVLFANFLWDKKNKTNLKASLLFSQAEDRDRWGVDCQSQHKIILFTWYYITSRSHHAMFLQKGSWTEMISRYANHCWDLKKIKRTIHKSQVKPLGFCWLLATLSSLMAVSHLGRCCITHK